MKIKLIGLLFLLWPFIALFIYTAYHHNWKFVIEGLLVVLLPIIVIISMVAGMAILVAKKTK